MAVYFPLTNIRGIELDPFAVQLARVTMWMGHKLAVDELDLEERVPPLVDLSGIRRGDALKLEWPRADAIIGSPPYHGDRFIRRELGDEYVEWLKSEFAIGVKDYCVYWFRKAHDCLPPGGRAGLVGTNSVAEGVNRGASLDYIADGGGVITAAVSSQDWSGEAAVHVSVVNWIKAPGQYPSNHVLAGLEVSGITSSLRPRDLDFRGFRLLENAGKQFFGVVQSGDGFILDDDRAAALLSRTDAEYDQVIKRFLVGDEITSSPTLGPTRWVIDFGEMPLEDAEQWPEALKIVREIVKPARDVHQKRREREEWWKFSRTVRSLFEAVEALPKFIACPATAKRFYMVWCEPDWVPSNATSVFAFDSDYAMGVLTSRIHSE